MIAEGAGVLVLESARRRAGGDGARSWARSWATGTPRDAFRITEVHPEGAGALRAMQRALADAGMAPADVEYVNAHGTSTAINDPVETAAIRRLLGERAGEVPVSSNKSMIGHTIGAAGAIEAILTLRGMAAGVLLPTINQEAKDPRCDLDYVPNRARRRGPLHRALELVRLRRTERLSLPRRGGGGRVTGRVAIVAAAARTALGRDLPATWEALLAGEGSVRPVTGFDASGFGTPCAAQVATEAAATDGDPAMRILGRHGHLLLGMIAEVHERGEVDRVPRERVGLFVALGTTDSPVEDLAPGVLASRGSDSRLDLARFFAGAYRQVHPLWPLAMLNNVAAGQIAIDLDLRGDNTVLSSESDAGVRACLEAVHSLREGTADVALTGGVAETVAPASLARLRLRGVLGDGPARPLAPDGAGCSPGEGAAAFVLAPERALGARRPLAFLRGGATAWGRDPARPGPTREAFRRAVAEALRASGVKGDDLDAVFLHAEGRAEQDRAELLAVGDVCGRRARLVALKGALGHAGSAAPFLDLAVAVRAVAAGTLPPTLPAGPRLAEAEGRSATRAEAAVLRRILVVAAGAHGGAGALVLEAAH